MGNKFSESKQEVGRVPYTVVQGDNDTPRVDIDGRLYTPQELSAMILQKMKKTAEDYLGEEIENWNYQKLDETNRVAKIIKEKIQS